MREGYARGIRDLMRVEMPAGTIDLSGGVPSPETVPERLLERLARSAVRDDPRRLYEYPPGAGLPELREAVAVVHELGRAVLARIATLVTPDTILGNYDGRTGIHVAAPPYTQWTTHESRVTRLDGPNLFSLDGQIFAVGRYQPDPNGFFTRMGGALSRKRTAIYRVEEGRLVKLSDLPSNADTSYAGVALRDGFLWVDWYTSRTDRDWPWLFGMPLRTDIKMARIPLQALRDLSAETP